ncbi:MAG: glycosyltransferase family 39 protein [Nanoarchaeota archaeon]|nr:glycosyltransferase family 39 protein [Nanoarchaeota archaeon]
MPQPKINKTLTTFLIFSFLTYFWLNSLITVPDWDALSYIMNGKTIAGEQKYYEWHRPLLLPLILGINFIIFGFTELIPRILGPLLSTFTLFAIYKLGSEIYNKKTGIYASLIFFFIPLTIYWAPRMYSAIPCIGLIAMSMYFVDKYAKNSNPNDMIFFGIFASLAFLMRYVGAASLIMGLIYLLYKNKLNKDFLKAIVSFLLVSTPFFYLNWVNTGNPIYSMSIANNQMAEFTPTRLDYYLKNMLIIYTPPLLILLTITLLNGLRLIKNSRREITIKKDDGLIMSLLLFGFFVLYFQAWLNLKSLRYIIPTFLGFALLCGKGFEITMNWLNNKTNLQKYTPHTLFIICSISLIILAPKFFTSCNQYIEIGEYLNTLNGNVVSPAWPYYNYYSERTVKWFPGTYEQLLEETQTFGIKYAVLTDWASEPEWATNSFFETSQEFTKINTFTGCIGTVSVYEYSGTVNGALNTREPDVINSNAFVPLKIIP